MNTSKLKLILLATIGVIAVIVFATIINKYVLKSKAAGEVVTITTTVPPTDVSVGKESNFAIILTAPESKGISAMSFGLTASNIRLLDIPHVNPMDQSDPTVFTEVQKIVAPDGSSIFKSAVTIQSDDKLPRVIGFTVQFTCTAEGPAKIAFDRSKIEVTGNITGDVYSVSNEGEDSILQFNCASSSGGVITPVPKGPSVRADFTPGIISAPVNSNFTTAFKLSEQPAGKGFSAFDLTLSFNPALIEVSKIGDLFDGSYLATLAKSSPQSFKTLASPSCTADVDCKACLDLGGTNCVTGICTSGVCDYTNLPSRPVPSLSCKTNQDCMNIVIGAGLCGNGRSDVCPKMECSNGTCRVCPADEPTCGGPITLPSSGPTKIIPSIEPLPPFPPSNGLCTQIAKSWNNSIGEVHIAYVCILPAEKLPTSPSINLLFRAKATGSGLIHIVKIKAAGNIDGDSYSVNPFDATYTVTNETGLISTPTPPLSQSGGTVKLNLKLKFQGIESKPADPYNSYMVKCGIACGGPITPVEQTAEFKANEKGIWNGTLVYSGVQPGSCNKIFCKGPKQMQKRVCNNVPTETFPGSYNPNCDKERIILTNGENNLDFTGIYMLVGDLPAQDGIANSADMARVIKFFDQSTPEAIKAADLNGDGAVNAYDYSYMAGAFAHHLDDL